MYVLVLLYVASLLGITSLCFLFPNTDIKSVRFVRTTDRSRSPNTTNSFRIVPWKSHVHGARARAIANADSGKVGLSGASVRAVTSPRASPSAGSDDFSVWKTKRDAIVSLLMEIQPGKFAIGTGFLIRHPKGPGYIVTAGHNVLVPTDQFDGGKGDGSGGGGAGSISAGSCFGRCGRSSQLRTLPSEAESTKSSEIQKEADGSKKQKQGAKPRRVLNLTATVTTLNGVVGSNRAVVCQVVGTCGAADLAVLHAPEITNAHTHLDWSLVSSRQTLPDQPCFVIGDTLGENVQSCAQGVIRSNSYFDPEGQQVVESMLVTALGYSGNSGSPILTVKGDCLGIFTFGTEGVAGMGGGVAQVIAQPLVHSIIQNHVVPSVVYAGVPSPSSSTKLANRDNELTYYYRNMQSAASDSPSSSNPSLSSSSSSSTSTNESMATTNQVDEDGDIRLPWMGVSWRAYTTLERMRLNNPSFEIRGAVVSSIEDEIMLQHKQDAVEETSRLKVGDLVLEINGIVIGNLAGQLPPTSAFWLNYNASAVEWMKTLKEQTKVVSASSSTSLDTSTTSVSPILPPVGGKTTAKVVLMRRSGDIRNGLPWKQIVINELPLGNMPAIYSQPLGYIT